MSPGVNYSQDGLSLPIQCAYHPARARAETSIGAVETLKVGWACVAHLDKGCAHALNLVNLHGQALITEHLTLAFHYGANFVPKRHQPAQNAYAHLCVMHKLSSAAACIVLKIHHKKGPWYVYVWRTCSPTGKDCKKLHDISTGTH